MNLKIKVNREVKRQGERCSEAYLNMLLKGTKDASYKLSVVLGKIFMSPVEVWCDENKRKLRKGVFRVWAESQEGK